MNNNLLLGTKYERTELVARIANAEWEADLGYREFFKEILQNYKRIAGYIYSAADLAKLNLERRPSWTHNLFRGPLLQLLGNFINNQSKVEAQPRTPGDVQLANIITDLVDYAHYTANDLQSEFNKAYLNSSIARIGWLVHDWTWDNDVEGMIRIQSYDPFRLMWDNTYTKKDLSTSSWIIDRGWYTPEEMCNLFALDKDDLYDEIMEKAKLYLGTDRSRGDRLVRFAERIWGTAFQYRGKDQGYDEVTRLVGDILYNNGQYYDTQNGLFKVVEFHERRSEKIITLYDGEKDKEYDISKQIDLKPNGRDYDSEKLNYIKSMFKYPVVKGKYVNQLYNTAVCPSFNIVLSEAPYEVQNGNFKYTPIFCFDWGQDSLDWKSYVDDMVDVIASMNLYLNTLDTSLLKTNVNEVWYEEDALGAHKDEFLTNKIGGIKEVAKGGLNKIKKIEPSPLSPAHQEMFAMKDQILNKVSNVPQNMMGRKESANEPARLFAQRVAQAEILQSPAQDNAISQLRLIGENTKDNLLKFLGPGRAIRIANDETDPYWIQLNQDIITKVFVDPKTGITTGSQQINGNIADVKCDIVLSKAPFGKAAKQQEFQELMQVNGVLMQLNPAYVDPETIVKSSNLRSKDTMLNRIKEVDKSAAQQQQVQQQKQDAVENLAMEKQKGEVQKQQLDNKDKQNDLMLDEVLKQGALS